MGFVRIGHRLLVYVGAIVILGVIGIVATYAINQETVLTRETEAALAKTSESVEEGLSALMLAGHASAAPDFAIRLKSVPNVVDYRILRNDGTEAFMDNSTVDKVNELFGDTEFTGRPGEPPTVRVFAETDPDLEHVRNTGNRVFVYTTLPGGERQITSLGPIKKLSSCKRCHEAEEKVRGVLKLTVSLAALDQDVQKTWQISVMLIVIALGSMVALIYWVAHRTVVSHIVDFSSAMKAAADGDLSVRLPGKGNDELAHMARSFNHMNQELIDIYAGLREEQNKLNTIIQGADSGIVVTDGQQKIVLVNQAAEKLLGKNEAQIIRNGFLNLFDDRGWMEQRLAATDDKDHTAIREHRGRILSVQASTIRIADGSAIGSAALIRDITEEKKLEDQLKQQSITDALTGLFNRRHFDEILLTEFKRWQRYAQPLSVMMLDVDHFKRFNDTHGHECGDRVLIAIGAVLKAVASPIGSASVFPCRYGGEEMVLILAGMNQEQGATLAEKIRLAIADLVIDGLRVTVSIGVAGCPGHSIENGDELVRLADDALYTAKENGRNQVRAASPLPEPDPSA